MTATALPTPTADPAAVRDVLLPITIRKADGHEIQTALPASRHRHIHLGLLHELTAGWVELAAGRRNRRGKLHIYTREFEDHFLRGGGDGNPEWRKPILALAARHEARGEEIFVGVAPRATPGAGKENVLWTRWLWIDIDTPGYDERIERFLARFPAHMEIATAGGRSEAPNDRHRHLLWRLASPLLARTVTDRLTGRRHTNPLEVTERLGGRGRPRILGYRDPTTGYVVREADKVEWIERSNLRLIHQLGHTRAEKPSYIADKPIRERCRVLRLAGSVNYKTGRHAHIARLDLRLPPYDIRDLVGRMPDPPHTRPVRKVTPIPARGRDPYRDIPAAVYFPLFTGVELPASGNVNCPLPGHVDENPSCNVTDTVLHCHGCDLEGTIYDLWSGLQGGPVGDVLACDKALFHRVAEEVREKCRHLISPATAAQ
jgi:hypothetical protein